MLRGYPIGAIVLSPVLSSRDGKAKFEILDGQQRLTAIGLGMLDTNKSNDVFKTTHNNIRIFIDLGWPDTNDNRKYIFRVITRSHPWGYQRKDNLKPIESKNKRLFLKTIDIGNPLDEDTMNKFYPFDAYLPVPFDIFINSNNLKDIKNKIEVWKKLYFKGIKENRNTGGEPLGLYGIEEIRQAVKQMKKDISIPALYLNLPEILANQEKLSEKGGRTDEENDNERLDEIENMFVRLNAGGTPLSGEELNYSILKTHIDPKVQKQIEDACKGLFRPARFINLAYRLWGMKGEKERNFYRLAAKPKAFQQSIKKERNEFVEFIKLLCTGDKNRKSLLETVKDILTFEDKRNKYGLPFIAVSRLGGQVPEIMYMLMYRMYFKKDGFDDQGRGSDLKRKLLGIVTIFSWLGKGEQKDHSQLLRNIFPAMIKLNRERFWSWETVQRASLPYNDKNVLTSFPLLNELYKEIELVIKNNERDLRNGFFDKIDAKIQPFVKKIFWNKSLLLYAQRKDLSKRYGNVEHFMLEDTNVPFDWDHIFPNDFIRHKRGITKSLKDWYPSNGNFLGMSV